MNDYKELIELLAHPADGRDNADIMISAAVAIEQLVKENYEWCLSYSDECAYSQKEIKRLTKERDAAIYEMRREADNCKWCKWWKPYANFKYHCTCPETCCVDGNPDKWEWRGVQE